MVLGLGFVKPVCYDVIFPFISMSSSSPVEKQNLQQIGKMVLENGVVDSPERVGFYSGTIQSMFAILNVVTSAFFAIISDSLSLSHASYSRTVDICVRSIWA